jgi:hypothetical protein
MAKQQTRRFPCRNCGAMTETSFLYCKQQCHDEFIEKRRTAKADLLAAGFVQHPEARNTFLHDGVSVSIEQVMRDGLEQTIKAHTEIVAVRAADPAAGESATRGE